MRRSSPKQTDEPHTSPEVIDRRNQTALAETADGCPAGSQLLVRAHRIALDPTKEQIVHFQKASGIARFAYNWGLKEWQRQYKAGLQPTTYKINKALNAIKHIEFPWMKEVTSYAPEAAISSLGMAFDYFFTKKGQYPRFKKKGYCRDSFLASRKLHDQEHAVRVDHREVQLPRIGWVRMHRELRYTEGTILSATVSRTAERWFVSLVVRFEVSLPVQRKRKVVGVDLGVSRLATLSDGTTVVGPKALKANLKKLQRLSKACARKAPGSANKKKATVKLSRLHARIANVRSDALHKLTHGLIRDYSVIGIEDLNVTGLKSNSRIARQIEDVGMYEFRRQLLYKAEASGTQVVLADKWFPSTKLCSSCGVRRAGLLLSDRDWICSCGAKHDRDLNAAINLENMAGSSPVSACGAIVQKDFVLKQEPCFR